MPLEYYTEMPYVNTGATERLALAPTAPRRDPLGYVALCVGTLLLILYLARLPAPQPVVVLEPIPTGGSSVNILSNNCVGWCGR